jgi:hypothetical protein
MIKDLLQQLTFGHRLVVWRLLIALMLGGMIYYAFFVPSEGDRAVRRAADAMRHARSWKAETARDVAEIQGRLETLAEVSCPASARVTTHQTQNLQGAPPEWTNISLTLGDSSYSYSSVADRWTSDVTYGGGPRAVCQRLARGEDVEQLPPLNQWAKHALISKGKRRDTGSGFCQEWKITIPHHNANPEKGSVCLGEDDNLPRFAMQYGVESRYYDWNLPIAFERPEVAAAPGYTPASQ